MVIKSIKQGNEDLTIRNIALDDELYKLKKENDMLKLVIDDLMKKADVVNVTINTPHGPIAYVRGDLKLKLNIDIEDKSE